MISFSLSVAVLALLFAGIAFAAVRWLVTPYAARASRYYASAAAIALGAFVIAALLQVSRPGTASSTAVAAPAGHAFSCARTLRPVAGVAQGSVDMVLVGSDGTPVSASATVRRGSQLVVRGWAADAGVHHPLAGVCLEIDGKLVPQAVLYGGSRPDVVTVFKQSGALDTAFEIRTRVERMAPGRHRLLVVGVDDRNRDAPIAPPFPVTIR